jgi:hypothetical protein
MDIMENSMKVPQQIESKLLYNPTIPLPGICTKEMKSVCQRDTCTPMFTAPLFTVAKTRSQLNVHQQMNEQRKYGVYTQQNAIQS